MGIRSVPLSSLFPIPTGVRLDLVTAVPSTVRGRTDRRYAVRRGDRLLGYAASVWFEHWGSRGPAIGCYWRSEHPSGEPFGLAHDLRCTAVAGVVNEHDERG